MRFIDTSTYHPQRLWAAIDIAEIDDATIRLHWTCRTAYARPGLLPEPGDENLAVPARQAQILDIERRGST